MINKLKRQVQKLNEVREQLNHVSKQNDELLFANIFRDSIRSSAWLKDKSFSPYRSAANYSLLYKLYKIYDIYRPQNTLEFGLGQSTKLTAQYVASNPKAKATVIDDSQEWIDIFEADTSHVKNLRLKKLPVRNFDRQGYHQDNAEYDGLDAIIKKDKFNLVIVDGPIGYNKQYSRTNILGIVKNLAESFVVIFDDAERGGEQNTIELLRKELKKNEIDYADFQVSALKTQYFICSKDIYGLLLSI